jgi:hypothetical protein
MKTTRPGNPAFKATALGKPALNVNSKCSLTKVNSAFSLPFALSYLRSLRFKRRIVPGLGENISLATNSP